MDKEVKEFIEQNDTWQHVPHDLIDKEDEKRIKNTMAFAHWRFGQQLRLLGKELQKAIYEDRYKIIAVFLIVVIIALFVS